ncbi:tereporin-Ca1-like [Paramacrobiotus metropolitanus]|uniref:tereporin-Ca1-like n=1 Tax=Paramacrobiotus metropolitanus TaxID=2943436 RepID=UPI00244567CC|nr:tereporin-Ca1-like [Paramacrobiotus metropolitanus]
MWNATGESCFSSFSASGDPLWVSASQSPYDVAATIRLNNHTKCVLRLERCLPNYGHIESVINVVQPGQCGIMRMHKSGYSPTGTSETVSWNIEGTTASIVVMWSVPYNQMSHSNCLALGVCENGRHSASTFNDMYYNAEKYFKRKEFYRSVDSLQFFSKGIEIAGIMAQVPTEVSMQKKATASENNTTREAFQAAVQKEVQRQIKLQQSMSASTTTPGRSHRGRGFHRGNYERNSGRDSFRWDLYGDDRQACALCGGAGHREADCFGKPKVF